MSVSVDILSDSKDNVLSIPNQALKHDAAGYYVEEDVSSLSFTGSSTRKFTNSSSSEQFRFSSSTATSSSARTRNASGTRRRASTSLVTPGSQSTISLRRVPVTIGLQTDTQTEITSGLLEGEQIILKKTTISTQSASAPSITSLFRPQNQNRATTGTAATRTQ